ncbi:unnamed protein product [Diamesa tonsa]
MWKSTTGHKIINDVPENDDSWDTDPDYINDVSEETQRWGNQGKTVGSIDMKALREETENADKLNKKKFIEDSGITGSVGYGGKFGVMKDRMDKCAVGHDYVGKVEKHESQTDHKKGFGGKFGIETDRMDKCAVGHDYVAKVEKHESQTDHKKGFGGKFGIETDRMDKCAVGHDYVATVEKHESQTDHKKGFGGKFGIETGRMDASAIGYQDTVDKIGTNYLKTKPDISGAKPSTLRNKFENFALHSEDEGKERLANQKKIREEKDRLDREAAAKDFRAPITITRTPQVVQVETPAPINLPNAQLDSPKVAEPIQLPSAQLESPRISNPVQVVKVDLFAEEEPAPMKISVPEPVEDVKPEVVEIQSEVIVPQPMISNDELLEQQLVEQLRNDDVEPEATEEQFILSPDDPGLTAIALYDYQAAAEDEISFDPDDLITHIERIDEGWWRGLNVKTNSYGLFPANYTELCK